MPVRKSPSKKIAARVLMVDDNAHGLTARKTVLEEHGHQVTTTQKALEALDLFAAESFDVVITDYRMPGMNGLELIAALRKIKPGVPLILLSGFVETLGMTEQSSGADGVIQKSAHELPHLTRMVARLLNRQPSSAAAKPVGAAWIARCG